MKRIIKADAEWREELPREVYHVCRERGTEPPFSGSYHAHHGDGFYACACCGTPLFDSEAKFDSGTGWPSFSAAVEEDAVRTRKDLSHGMVREEVVCASCDAHLGHVFPDGPPPTGLRYCVNSVCLAFVERETAG